MTRMLIDPVSGWTPQQVTSPASMLEPYVALPIDPSTLAYWRLDAYGGAAWVDRVGGLTMTTLSGNAVIENALVGYHCVGALESAKLEEDVHPLWLRGDLTLEAIASTRTTYTFNLIDLGSGTLPLSVPYLLRLTSTTAHTAPSFGWAQSSSVMYELASATPLPIDARPRYIAATRSGGVARIYVDGVLVAEDLAAPVVPRTGYDRALRLSGSLVGGEGVLYTAAISSRAFAPAEITERYNAGPAKLGQFITRQ